MGEPGTTTGQAMTQRRMGEVNNFLALLADENFRGDLVSDESFTVFLAYAVKDHGVSPVSLAALLNGMSPARIEEWADGRNLPPGYYRPHVTDRIILLVRAAVNARERGVPMVELKPLPHSLAGT